MTRATPFATALGVLGLAAGCSLGPALAVADAASDVEITYTTFPEHEYRTVPGTSVQIAAPEAFVATDSPGVLRNEQTGAELIVTEYERPYEDVRTFFEANLTNEGGAVARTESLENGGVPGRFFVTSTGEGEARSLGMDWIYGDAARAVRVSAVCGGGCSAEAEALAEIVRTATWPRVDP